MGSLFQKTEHAPHPKEEGVAQKDEKTALESLRWVFDSKAMFDEAYASGEVCNQEDGKSPSFIGLSNKTVFSLDTEDGSLIWKYDIKKPLSFVPPVHLADGTVLLVIRNGIIQALKVKDKKMLWEKSTGQHLLSSFLVENSLILSTRAETGTKGKILSFSPGDGTLSWEKELLTLSPPAISKELLFLSTSDGFIQALDQTTGEVVWKRVRLNPASRIHMLPFGDMLLVGENENVYALEAKVGNLIWQFKAQNEIHPDIAVGEDSVFLMSADGLVYFLDLRSGAVKWKYMVAQISPLVKDAEIHISPVIINKSVVICRNDCLFVLGSDKGKLKFNKAMNDMKIKTIPGPVIFDQYLIATDGLRKIYILNTKTMKMLLSRDLDREFTGIVSIKRWGHNLVLLTEQGIVLCINLEKLFSTLEIESMPDFSTALESGGTQRSEGLTAIADKPELPKQEGKSAEEALEVESQEKGEEKPEAGTMAALPVAPALTKQEGNLVAMVPEGENQEPAVDQTDSEVGSDTVAELPIAHASPEPPLAEVSPEPPLAEVSPEPPLAEVSPVPPLAEVSPEPPLAEVSPEPPLAEVSPEPSLAEVSPEPLPIEDVSPEPPLAEDSSKHEFISSFQVPGNESSPTEPENQSKVEETGKPTESADPPVNRQGRDNSPELPDSDEIDKFLEEIERNINIRILDDKNVAKETSQIAPLRLSRDHVDDLITLVKNLEKGKEIEPDDDRVESPQCEPVSAGSSGETEAAPSIVDSKESPVLGSLLSPTMMEDMSEEERTFDLLQSELKDAEYSSVPETGKSLSREISKKDERAQILDELREVRVSRSHMQDEINRMGIRIDSIQALLLKLVDLAGKKAEEKVLESIGERLELLGRVHSSLINFEEMFAESMSDLVKYMQHMKKELDSVKTMIREMGGKSV